MKDDLFGSKQIAGTSIDLLNEIARGNLNRLADLNKGFLRAIAEYSGKDQPPAEMLSATELPKVGG